MSSLPKINQIKDTVSIAGWLFADLLLGLAMLFLVFNTVSSETPPESIYTLTPSISASTTPLQKTVTTPHSKVTATAQIGLDLTPSFIVVNVNAPKLLNGDVDEMESLRSQIWDKLTEFQGRRVGLVITLGYHPTVANGMILARTGNKILLEEYPEIFTGAVMKPFWYSLDDNHPIGTITFELYFFTNINSP